MANAMPMIERCALGQGGGAAYLDHLDGIARRAEAIFGSTSAVATNYAAVQKVIANLAEPTRAPIRNPHVRHGGTE